ncbi:MAG: methyltransferase [Anaerolineae bacterium]
MDYGTISRVLFGILLLNEAWVIGRSTPEQRAEVVQPRLLPLFGLLLLLPFFVALQLPAWLALPILALQAAGLLLEVLSELQLSRANSYAVSHQAATQPQAVGMYRYLENPIYTGLSMQFLAWGLFMPLSLICFALQLESCRKMVHKEREYLHQTFQFVHRGIDSFLWN